jgi:transaldolase/glucose-6-phosphate isomerase
MSKIKELAELGQSIWFDYIRRSLITNSDLQAMIDEGLLGVTANPSIFEKAIAGSADYDEEIKTLVDEGKSVEEIYDVLSIKDVGLAADLFKPVYEATDGKDGYVSLEVSPEIAHDTSKTIEEAKRLFETLGRPNVMIKIPATPEGLPAIEECIASGVSINVTLIFSVDNYKDVAEAYIKGLENLAKNGPTVKGGHAVDRIASVASFFVSRVDTAVDAALEKRGQKELQGKIAIANGKVTYALFQKIFSGDRWQKLAQKGARIQRVLWGSTGTKNPHYPDTLYVDALIGPDTVNTVPPATYNTFKEHGTVAVTLTQGVKEAEDQMKKLEVLGIDLEAITRKLQEDGVASFAKSFDTLLGSIGEKRERLLAGKRGFKASLGDFQSVVDKSLLKLRDDKMINRIWSLDHTVWKEDPAEISNRLGWLHSPDKMMEFIPEIKEFVHVVRGDGLTHALLLGMGGSSLAPEMFRHVFGVKEGYLDLSVLDSTDPGAVLTQARRIDPAKTLFIVSTKSGGTVETISFMKYFYNQTAEAVGKDKVGKHFIAITDPGSGLEKTAKELKFHRIFLNDPNIGGRFSALSYFGLIPGAFLGVDIATLLERACTMVCNCEGCNCPVAGDNSAAWLGTIMGEMANSGRDKLTLILSPSVSRFGTWLEQLLAESTGKEGKGILPIDGEEIASPDAYAQDRLFVYLKLEEDSTYDKKVSELEEAGHPVVHLVMRDPYDIGAEIFRWEMATAVAGFFLGINPFYQPNVESAKILARKMVTAYQKEGKLPKLELTLQENDLEVFATFPASDLKEALETFFGQAQEGDKKGKGRSYIALQAYLEPTSQTDDAFRSLRKDIHVKYRMATTLGYGPRFLHSTGQLHKGDGGHGLFIQFTADMPEDAPIPDKAGEPSSSISFGVLKMAQASGDRQALLDAGRHVIRFHLGKDPLKGLKKLSDIVKG